MKHRFWLALVTSVVLGTVAQTTPAAAATGPALSVDGVSLVVTSPALTGATTTQEGSTASLDAGATHLEITATADGRQSEGEGVVAGPGAPAQVLQQLVVTRHTQGATAPTAVTASLFGTALTGQRFEVLSPATSARVNVTDWALEADGRLWVLHLTEAPTAPPVDLTITVTQAAAAAPAVAVSPHVSLSGPTIPYPSWWGGGVCNSSQDPGAYQIANWGTFPVCAPGNGAAFTTHVPPVGSMPGYQCVELALRWLHQAYGIPSYYANGNTIYANYNGGALTKIANQPQGTPNPSPQPGDVISLGPYEQFGHVVVVYQNQVDANGNGSISTIEENASSSGTGWYQVVGWHVVSSHGVVGWLHAGQAAVGEGSIVRTPNKDIYRITGGAPLRISDCAPLGGCSVVTDVADLSHFAPYPADGTFLQTAENNYVYRVAGGAPVGIYSWATFGGVQPHSVVNYSVITELDHLRAVPADGTVLVAPDSQGTFIVAGGAPMTVDDWAPLGGIRPYVTVNTETITNLNHLNAVPADGTYLHDAEDSVIFHVAGGAPLGLTSWTPFGGAQASVLVNRGGITGGAHLNAVPADGTLLLDGEAGSLYRVAGGAPLQIATPATVGGLPAAVMVNDQTLASGADGRLRSLPANGTYIASYETGAAYRFAGGAPLRQYTWASLGGPHPVVQVNASTVARLDHMTSTPADGTLLLAAETAAVYRVAGGAPLRIPGAGAAAAVTVNNQTITTLDHLQAVPASGTYLGAADSNALYRVVGGAPVRLPNPAAAAPVSVPVVQATIDGLDHLSAFPASGSFLYATDSQRYYRSAGGVSLAISNCASVGSCTGAVGVEQASIDTHDHQRTVAPDGTVITAVPSNVSWVMAAGYRRALPSATGPSGAAQAGVTVTDDALSAVPVAPDVVSADSTGVAHTAFAGPASSAAGTPANHVRGVAAIPGGGWVLDAYGALHPFGTAPAVSVSAYWPGWEIARGVVARADGHSGYVLDGFGGLHPFGGAPAVTTTAYWPGWDIARAVVLRPDGISGWVVDGWGGIHPFGGAPVATPSGYWSGWDIVRGATYDPVSGGAWVLDGFGHLHPFAGAAPVTTSAYWANWDIARGVATLPGRPGSGYVLDGFGGLHPFGAAPSIPSPGYTPWNDAFRGLASA